MAGSETAKKWFQYGCRRIISQSTCNDKDDGSDLPTATALGGQEYEDAQYGNCPNILIGYNGHNPIKDRVGCCAVKKPKDGFIQLN
tara:strand:- start:304 stop:561 length:258 start_codon:yes stop_codon:yes gene_type:complete